jgi:twitching motility two-component system response regulator PilH
MDGHALMNGIGFFKRLLGNHPNGERQAQAHLRTTLGASVLVVDDSSTICAVLGKMLRQDGYLVLQANDGESAIEMARHEQPALIFLDIVMPGMNGFAVLRALRLNPLTRDIPIVMISGNPQATEQFYVQRFGADDFMKKPFGRDDVYQRISQLVASARLPPRMQEALAVSSPAVSAASNLVDDLADIPDIAMPDDNLRLQAAAPQLSKQVVLPASHVIA